MNIYYSKFDILNPSFKNYACLSSSFLIIALNKLAITLFILKLKYIQLKTLFN